MLFRSPNHGFDIFPGRQLYSGTAEKGVLMPDLDERLQMPTGGDILQDDITFVIKLLSERMERPAVVVYIDYDLVASNELSVCSSVSHSHGQRGRLLRRFGQRLGGRGSRKHQKRHTAEQ